MPSVPAPPSFSDLSGGGVLNKERSDERSKTMKVTIQQPCPDALAAEIASAVRGRYRSLRLRGYSPGTVLARPDGERVLAVYDMACALRTNRDRPDCPSIVLKCTNEPRRHIRDALSRVQDSDVVCTLNYDDIWHDGPERVRGEDVRPDTDYGGLEVCSRKDLDAAIKWGQAKLREALDASGHK